MLGINESFRICIIQNEVMDLVARKQSIHTTRFLVSLGMTHNKAGQFVDFPTSRLPYSYS